LTKLKKPTLLIASSESPLIDFEKEMAASIPNAQSVFIDKPQKFDAAIENFLQSLPPAPR
jgi:pimeloyl-ACP methyl ester carboxylesterase